MALSTLTCAIYQQIVITLNLVLMQLLKHDFLFRMKNHIQSVLLHEKYTCKTERNEMYYAKQV